MSHIKTRIADIDLPAPEESGNIGLIRRSHEPAGRKNDLCPVQDDGLSDLMQTQMGCLPTRQFIRGFERL